MTHEEKVLKSNNFDGFKPCNAKKLPSIIREFVYQNIINRIGCSMFEWHLPEDVLTDIPSYLIEFSINCGVAVLYKVPESVSISNGGKWACTPVEFTGRLTNIGTSETFITRGSDYAITNSELDKYVLIKNDEFMSNEYVNTAWYAELLNLTDIAIKALIKWCRVTPIAKATSGIDGQELKETLKMIWDGIEPYGIISDNTKMLTGQGMTSDDAVLRLTDENIVEKIHFLSELHYDVVRRICNLYNIPFHTTAKSAQVNESELHNTDIFSQMLTSGREKSRKQAVEEMKKVFDWSDISVSLGERFKDENKVIEQNIEENVSRETNNGDENNGNINEMD